MAAIADVERRGQESSISSDSGCEEPHAQDCNPLDGDGDFGDTDDDGSLDDFEESRYMDLQWKFDAEDEAITGVGQEGRVFDDSLHQVMQDGMSCGSANWRHFLQRW